MRDPKVYRKVCVNKLGGYTTNMYEEFKRTNYVLDSVEWQERTEKQLVISINHLFAHRENDPKCHAYILLHIQALRNLRKRLKETETEAMTETTETTEQQREIRKMSFSQYFTDSQHSFMSGCHDVFIACGWEDDEAYFDSKEALDDWENAFDLDEKKWNQTYEIANHRVTIYENEVSQYKAGQTHLPTRHRKTYVSSVWYHVEIMNLSTSDTTYFKTKINTTKPKMASLEKAWKRALETISI